MQTIEPIEVARAIAARQCPVPLPVDWVLLGASLRGAIDAGLVRVNHGCFDDWGGYSVTDVGRRALR